MDLRKIHLASYKAQKDAAEKTRAEAGDALRGGNAGVILPGTDNLTAGSCPRVAFLRHLGIEEQIPDNRRIMFELGNANEQVWTDRLHLIFPENQLRREEEIQVRYKLKSGREVTGRPDIVILDKPDGKPHIGIENKSVSSVWTARGVAFENEPKFVHMVQALHYMHHLGLSSYYLAYTSYVDWAIPFGNLGNSFPEWGKPGSEMCEYRYDPKKDEYRKLKVLPFHKLFQLRFNESGDCAEYSHDDRTWTPTPITLGNITAYYELVDTLVRGEAEELPPRPLTLKADGGKAPYSNCGYCVFNDVCTSEESAKGTKDQWDIQRWVDECRLVVGGSD